MTQTNIPLPDEAPIMVLPGAILFPNSILPLRIFEPRYRAMLEWVLENDRMFCVALMKPEVDEAETEEQFFHTAGIGLVSASVTQPDGTSHLMLQGLARVRFTGFPQRVPFRIGKIEALPEVAHNPEKTAPLANLIRKKCGAVRVNGAPLPDAFAKTIAQISDPASLLSTVANALVSDPVTRQRLLELPDTGARLLELMRILDGYLAD